MQIKTMKKSVIDELLGDKLCSDSEVTLYNKVLLVNGLMVSIY